MMRSARGTCTNSMAESQRRPLALTKCPLEDRPPDGSSYQTHRRDELRSPRSSQRRHVDQSVNLRFCQNFRGDDVTVKHICVMVTVGTGLLKSGSDSRTCQRNPRR
jgi:hypothetical protein